MFKKLAKLWRDFVGEGPPQSNLTQLPGSKYRIEKATTFPTSGKPNPFLRRYDPAKRIQPYND